MTTRRNAFLALAAMLTAAAADARGRSPEEAPDRDFESAEAELSPSPDPSQGGGKKRKEAPEGGGSPVPRGTSDMNAPAGGARPSTATINETPPFPDRATASPTPPRRNGTASPDRIGTEQR